MTAFKVSVIGGPILLIVSGCLDRSGAWCEWHWNWLHTSGEMFGNLSSNNRVHLPSSNHVSAWGVFYRAIPRWWAVAYMYCNDYLDRFWVGLNVMRPGFRRVSWAHGPSCKAKIQGTRTKQARGSLMWNICICLCKYEFINNYVYQHKI